MRVDFGDAAIRPWRRSGSTLVRGRATGPREVPLEGESLRRHVEGSGSEPGDFRDVIAGLNGHFAAVKETARHLMVAVDRVRSHPLYLDASAPSVSDRPEVLVPAGRRHSNIAQVAAFRRAGYTIGRDTLVHGVLTLDAGDIAIWDKDRPGTGWQFVRYFTHLRHPEAGVSRGQLAGELVVAIDTAFERLVRRLAGRPVLVPLSGGLDSRLVVAGLLRHGHDRIHCITYGRPTSYEVKTAEAVAASFGLEWTFIAYDRALFRDAVAHATAGDFRRIAGQWVTVPQWQEYPAFLALERRGLLPAGAVVVPGYSADLLAGSYVPADYGSSFDPPLSADGIRSYIRSRHLTFRHPLDPEAARALESALARDLATYPTPSNASEFIAVHEAWMTHNKVTKFVLNGLRVYETFSLDWEMPLWDDAFVAFWYRVPDEFRLHEQLYAEVLDATFFRPYGVDIRGSAPLRRSPAARALARRLPRGVVVRLKKTLDRLTRTDTQDFNASEAFARVLAASGDPLEAGGRVSEQLAQTTVLDYLERELLPGLDA